MPSLPDLQREFLSAILGDGTFHDARIEVYANNARANFLGSLRSSYPVVLRLVGDEYFVQCAHAFQRAQPSCSGDLLPAGHGFDEFLRDLHDGAEYDYLSHVARFEWLCQESLLAAAHAPLNVAALLDLAPERYDALKFVLHPGARLFHSRYPCLRIWQVNLSDAEPPLIVLAGGGDNLVLLRTAGELKFHALSAGEATFLQALQSGTAFAAAVDTAAACGDFEASGALQRFVRHEVIVDFE